VLQRLSLRRDPDGARQASRAASAARRGPAEPLRELRAVHRVVRIPGHWARRANGATSARVREADSGQFRGPGVADAAGRLRRKRRGRRATEAALRRGQLDGLLRRRLRGHTAPGHGVLSRRSLFVADGLRLPAAPLRASRGTGSRRCPHSRGPPAGHSWTHRTAVRPGHRGHDGRMARDRLVHRTLPATAGGPLPWPAHWLDPSRALQCSPPRPDRAGKSRTSRGGRRAFSPEVGLAPGRVR